MTRRSYDQHCALARALDVVGERWTLLLIRELMTGPRRYKDLALGLAGIGTNLLAARLRDLTDAGLVEQEGTRYRLTERGLELEPAVLALARFGAPYLEERDEDHLWLPRWNAVALRYAFQPERASSLQAVVEFRVDDEVVQASIDQGTVETSSESIWDPDLSLECDGETFLALAAGELDPKSAEADGSLTITGDRRRLRSCLAAFRG
jgi:DNA-binding HxlR family transcriptional regulator/putative sterol carrier protein